jgi:hypothetical protein
MNLDRKLLFITLLLLSVLTACTEDFLPAPRPTLMPYPTFLPPTATSTEIPPTATATPFSPNQLTKEYSQLYGLPEIGYPIKATIRKSEPMTVIGRSSDSGWLQIKTENGLIAWLSAADINVSEVQSIQQYPVIDIYQVTPQSILQWKGKPVGTVCLNVQSKFTGTYAADHPDAIPDLLFNDQVLGLLHAAGIKTAVPSGPCDATLTVAFTIEPKGRSFPEAITNIKSYSYNALNISSDWTLSQDKIQLKFNLKKVKGGPDKPLYCQPITPYQTDVKTLVHAGLNKLWGPAILKSMLLIADPETNNQAIELAGASGSTALAAVPQIIPYLEDPDHSNDALHALKTITGKGYRNDMIAWQEWWQTQVTKTTVSP